MMYTDADRWVDILLHSLTKLRVTDDGLAAGHDMADLNAIAALCFGAKLVAQRAANVHDMLLFELSDATQALLLTAVMPPDGDVVKRWLRARGEYLSCRLGAL